MSFHVEQPAARAPQAILLAVAPDEAHVWSLATLEATVLETLDLARLRLVDGEALAAGPPPPGGAVPRSGTTCRRSTCLPRRPRTTVTSDLGRCRAAS